MGASVVEKREVVNGGDCGSELAGPDTHELEV